jgi:hypothetical protein
VDAAVSGPDGARFVVAPGKRFALRATAGAPRRPREALEVPRRGPRRARPLGRLAAYEEAIARTSSEHAPWYVVPSDRKCLRNWDPRYPEPAEDLDAIRVA